MSKTYLWNLYFCNLKGFCNSWSQIFNRIGIADKNDNPPYFDKHLYEAEVDENEDIQHTVLTVTANDKDECKYQYHVCSTLNWSFYSWNLLQRFEISLWLLASRIRYEITRGNFGGAFAVKNMTGAIYVAGPLDYENRKRVSTQCRKCYNGN